MKYSRNGIDDKSDERKEDVIEKTWQVQLRAAVAVVIMSQGSVRC